MPYWGIWVIRYSLDEAAEFVCLTKYFKDVAVWKASHIEAFVTVSNIKNSLHIVQSSPLLQSRSRIRYTSLRIYFVYQIASTALVSYWNTTWIPLLRKMCPRQSFLRMLDRETRTKRIPERFRPVHSLLLGMWLPVTDTTQLGVSHPSITAKSPTIMRITGRRRASSPKANQKAKQRIHMPFLQWKKKRVLHIGSYTSVQAICAMAFLCSWSDLLS